MAEESVFDKLLGNKLLLQYLSAAGQDIASGKPLGANVNAVTMQNIAAQNYAKMLKGFLSGGAKVTIDKDKFSITGPASAFQAAGGPGSATPLASPQENIGLRDEATGTAGVPTTINETKPVQTPAAKKSSFDIEQLVNLLSGGAGFGNPNQSPLDNLTPSDLAGLTPQDIASVVKLGLAKEEVEAGKEAGLLRYLAQAEKNRIDEMKALKEGLTSDVKNYQFAVSQGFKGSFEDFLNVSQPGAYKEYLKAKEEGYEGSFYDWKTELAERAKPEVKIENKLGEKLSMAEIQTRVDLKTGRIKDSINEAVNKIAENDIRLMALRGKPDKFKEEIRKLKAIELESRIENGGGKVIDVKFDSATGIMRFKVRWSDGSEESYSYGLDG